jgi:hypothetical protein
MSGPGSSIEAVSAMDSIMAGFLRVVADSVKTAGD